MSLYGYKPKWKKALWVKSAPAKRAVAAPQRRKPVRKVSKARSVVNRAYAKAKAEYLARNPQCEAHNQIFGLLGQPLSVRATDIHHTRGRAGSLLTDCRFWLGVCRACHNWIGDNMDKARERGLLCEKGKWNSTTI